MKLLYISNIAGEHAVSSFSRINLMVAKKENIDFHLAENFDATPDDVRKTEENNYGFFTHHIDFIRTPYNPKNINAYKQIIKLIKEEKVDAIHCNTPIGGVIGRLAGKKCGIKKIIYQAHGFHFYKGASFINWIIYYPIEKWLARYTDALITINQEDYKRAKKFHLRNNGKVYFVPGVGIDTTKYEINGSQLDNKRNELGFTNDDIIVISAGDLIKRKNYKTSIKAIAKANNKNIQYLICGQGPEKKRLEKLSKKYGIESQVHFLGYRTDIKELLSVADIFLFTTFQEGLPRSLSEAMASGLPCVASKIRGNIDLVTEECGFLFAATDSESFGNAILKLANDAELRKSMGQASRIRIKDFSDNVVSKAIFNVYNNELLNK